jgi:hypothetical protein
MDKVNPGRMGSGGFCICVKCGTRIPHRRGIPCMQERCPKCGKVMLREGGEHHRSASRSSPRR